MKSLFKSMGTYLREKRLESGLSQVEVAKKLGYKSQFIANWERGASSPPMSVLRKIVSLYSIPEKEIVGFLMDLQREYLKKELRISKKSKIS